MATTYAKTSDTELQVTVETAVVDQVTYTITQLNELKQRNLNEIARIEQEILTLSKDSSFGYKRSRAIRSFI